VAETVYSVVKGDGIVWAVISSGIDQRHAHFRRHKNLELQPPLRHRDFTADDRDEDASELEALVDQCGLGTHIAGIIGGELAASDGFTIRAKVNRQDDSGDSKSETMDLPAIRGMAPKCKLVSLKVLNDFGQGLASQIIRALRWVIEVNRQADQLLIHGVSLALGYPYEHKLYACGQSPLCIEVERLVKSGVVAVTAAGNNGFGTLQAVSGMQESGFALTIADPGNAELAITVGSTHRENPMPYGISYFSSKGPTMDGRMKPDLVAPGERIISCASGRLTQGSGWDRSDNSEVPIAPYSEDTGTSAAEAHVSGVAAALLSVRRALIGRPEEVKRLLLATATDLKRWQFVQGRGLVNLHKALAESAAFSPHSPPIVDSSAPREPQLAATPSPIARSPAEDRLSPQPKKRFAVAMSFPGAYRDYVRKVTFALRRGGLLRENIFYDEFFEAELARTDLDTYLQGIYHDESELIVVFLSAEYERKTWCGLEWRALRDIIKQRRSQDVMPLRFDATSIPGLFSIDGYIDLRRGDRDPEEIADLVLGRIKHNQRIGV
jgi:subtilisin family serine protease